MTNVKVQTENNYSNTFNFTGTHISLGQDFKLDGLPLSAELELGYGSHTGEGPIQAQFWDVSVGLRLAYHHGRWRVGAGYSKGFGRLKADETALEPCQFLSSCQFDRLLGGFSNTRFDLSVEYD